MSTRFQKLMSPSKKRHDYRIIINVIAVLVAHLLFYSEYFQFNKD